MKPLHASETARSSLNCHNLIANIYVTTSMDADMLMDQPTVQTSSSRWLWEL